MNRSCLRFLAGNKHADLWREKKRRNSQNFRAKMPEKISHFSHFFALIGNTGGGPDKIRKICKKKNEDILYWLDETPTPAHSKTNKTELFSNLFHHTYLILLKRRGHSFLLQSGWRKEMVARSRTNNYHCYMFLHHMASMETKHLYQQIRITVKLSQCQLIFQFALISWIFKN